MEFFQQADAFKSDMQLAEDKDPGSVARKKEPIYLIYPPLFEAVNSGDIESVRLIVDPPPEEGVTREPVDVGQRDNIGANVMHWATGRNEPLIIVYLQSIGVPVNQQDRNGMTPLHYACNDNKLSASLALVDAGADVNIQDVSYCTPLHRAIPVDEVLSVALLKHCVKTVRVDLRNSEGQSLIVVAARYNRVKMIQALLILGANINDSDMYGWTAAHWAARKNHHQTMAVLLSENADVSKQDHGWYTPLEIAAHESSDKVHKQLERHIVADTDATSATMNAKISEAMTKQQDRDSVNINSRSMVKVEDQKPSAAIELLNWLDGNQLKNQYERTKKEVTEKLRGYGGVKEVVIPLFNTPRAGAVYCEFYVQEEAARAMDRIAEEMGFVDRYYCYENLKHIQAECEDWDKESSVLVVYNLVERSLLLRDDEVEDVKRKVKKAFEGVARVMHIHIPPPRESDNPNILAAAFVEFKSLQDARIARKKVGIKNLRKNFSPNTQVAFYSETLYNAKIFLQVGNRVTQAVQADIVDMETAREAVGKVSKIVVIDGLLEDEELESESEIYAVQMSVMREARKYGEPEQVYIPRLTDQSSLSEAGVGRVFLVMDNRGSAQAALRAFQLDTFSFASVEFYPEVMFEMGHYSEDVSIAREVKQAQLEIGNLEDNESRIVVIDNFIDQDSLLDSDLFSLVHLSITNECREMVDPSSSAKLFVRIPRVGETGAGRVFVVCPTLMDGKRVRGGLRRGPFGFASISYMSEVLFESNMLDRLISYDEIDDMTGLLSGGVKISESLAQHRFVEDKKPAASNKLVIGGLIHDADLATDDMPQEEQYSKDQELDRLLQAFQNICERFAPVSIIDLMDTDPDEEVLIMVECPKPNDARAIKNGLAKGVFAYLRVGYNQSLKFNRSKSSGTNAKMESQASMAQSSGGKGLKGSMTSVANLLNHHKSSQGVVKSKKNKTEATRERMQRGASMARAGSSVGTLLADARREATDAKRKKKS